MHWLVLALGAGFAAAAQFLGPAAEEDGQLAQKRRELRQKRVLDEAAADDAQERQRSSVRAAARAFWRSQVGKLGEYHFVGVPSGTAVLLALDAVRDDTLVLRDGQGQLVHVSLWDVDGYDTFTSP